ncbi:MAG: hypothetical protein HY901_29270 [Deltaproteobacteria bacterium]|nr:hypothetical protein [Deltaproteobacteria bacterium]
MSSDDRKRFEDDLAAAKAEVTRLHREHTQLAKTLRVTPSPAGKDLSRRAAAALAAARDRVKAAQATLVMFDKTGKPHGLIAEQGQLFGSVAVEIKGGSSRRAREQAINDALGAELARASEALGVVLAAAPAAYTKERPGRDAQGRTVLEVAGRVEGEVLVPAISRASKALQELGDVPLDEG